MSNFLQMGSLEGLLLFGCMVAIWISAWYDSKEKPPYA